MPGRWLLCISHRRPQRTPLLVIVVFSGWAGVCGCSQDNRHLVLSLLVEDVPQSGAEYLGRPVIRSPRREPIPTATPAPTATPTAVPGEEEMVVRTWDDVLRRFPKNLTGSVDWVHALESKMIEPKPGIDPKAEDQAPLALDLELTSKSRPSFKVVFSHQTHTEWLACPNCHTGIFEMTAGAAEMTMSDLYEGKYCGVCHGPVAFDIATGCQQCHFRDLPKDPTGNVDWVHAFEDKVIEPKPGLDPRAEDQAPLALDVELTPEALPSFKVVFSHQTHTEWLSCANCHPSIFQMAAGADEITMADLYDGKYCAVCHGKVAFGIADACDRCHAVLRPTPTPPGGGAAPAEKPMRSNWEKVLEKIPKDTTGSVDWVRALEGKLINPKPGLDPKAEDQAPLALDIELTPKSRPAYQVTFSHQAHTEWLACPNCHTDIFEMTAGAAEMTMADLYAGKYCGTCHGKVAFDIMTGCPRCHAALKGAR